MTVFLLILSHLGVLAISFYAGVKVGTWVVTDYMKDNLRGKYPIKWFDE